MLELPESRTLARQLDEAVAGRRIEAVVAAKSPHRFAWFSAEPDAFAALLVGRRIGRAESFGGFVELVAEDARLFVYDGVNLRLAPPGEKEPAKHQLRLELDDGSAINVSVQMYGGFYAGPLDEAVDNKYYRLARERPDPLGDGFDRAYFETLLAGHPLDKLSAKAFLATEQRIPGLGNGCLQDILFAAGLHPKRKMNTLGDEERDKLLRSVREVLADMAARRGRDTERDLYGEPGGYQTLMSKNTLAYPCPACGGALQKMAYLGGSVYLCPTCQPL